VRGRFVTSIRGFLRKTKRNSTQFLEKIKTMVTKVSGLGMWKKKLERIMKASFHINSTAICIEHGKRQIPFEQITHLEGDVNYTIIHTIDGKKIISAFTLKRFSDITENALFIRTHKSFIINLLYMKSYQPNEKTLFLEGDKKIIISRRKKEDLEKALQLY
jgi:DNA-binding LytR/AlgR family response regulator